VEVKKEEDKIIVTPLDENNSAMWGTTRAVINNMVV
jgi:ribosomal protein L6P/L9E